jgi:hypothetical protein
MTQDPQVQIGMYLRTKGVQDAVIKDMLDQFAHNLAEAIRAEGNRRDVVNNELEAMGFWAAADLIDPEVQHGE